MLCSYFFISGKLLKNVCHFKFRHKSRISAWLLNYKFSYVTIKHFELISHNVSYKDTRTNKYDCILVPVAEERTAADRALDKKRDLGTCFFERKYMRSAKAKKKEKVPYILSANCPRKFRKSSSAEKCVFFKCMLQK